MPEVKKSQFAIDFERAYQQALPGAPKFAESKALQVASKAKAKGLTFAGMGGTSELQTLSSSGLQKNFCTSWPKIEKFLKMAIGLASWWPGSAPMAAMAMAAISAMNSTLYPTLCPTTPTPPAE